MNAEYEIAMELYARALHYAAIKMLLTDQRYRLQDAQMTVSEWDSTGICVSFYLAYGDGSSYYDAVYISERELFSSEEMFRQIVINQLQTEAIKEYDWHKESLRLTAERQENYERQLFSRLKEKFGQG